MQLVDLTGIWRDGEFYRIKPIDGCVECAFLHDGRMYGKNCWEALECEGSDVKKRRGAIYIKADDESVANYVQLRMDYGTKD